MYQTYHRHATKSRSPRRFKAAGVLKYFWLTFKVKQGLFCQDSAAVNLCSSESATLHTNGSTGGAPGTPGRDSERPAGQDRHTGATFMGWLRVKNALDGQILAQIGSVLSEVGGRQSSWGGVKVL